MVVFVVTMAVVITLLIAYFVFSKRQKAVNTNRCEELKKFKEYLEHNVNNIQELPLAGIREDGNSDYEFAVAVKKIVLPDNARVKIYE